MSELLLSAAYARRQCGEYMELGLIGTTLSRILSRSRTSGYIPVACGYSLVVVTRGVPTFQSRRWLIKSECRMPSYDHCTTRP